MDKMRTLRLKTLLTAVLTVILALSLVFAAACSSNGSATNSSSSSVDSSSSGSETTTSRTDYQTITNGDFEYKHDSATSFPVTTNIGWTRSYDSTTTTAVSTDKYSSGIIRVTTGDDYDKFAKENGLYDDESETAFNPSTPEKLGYLGDGSLYVYDEEVKNEEKIPTSGDHILMIHNHTNDETGTAQKFTSSSTVTVDGYGKLTVWVLTHDLKSQIEGVKYGAYISLSNTLGTSKEPLVIEGINTEDKWQKFEIYLAASDLATSSVKVVLGLGFGSKNIRTYYVEGFAFFDNVHYEEITAEEYAAGTNGIAAENTFTAYNETEVVATHVYMGTVGTVDNFNDVNATVADYSKAEDLRVTADALVSSDNAKGYKEYSLILSHKLPTAAYSAAGKTTESKNDVYKRDDVDYEMNATLGVSAFDAIGSATLDGIENPVAADAETIYMIHDDGSVINADSTKTTVPYGATSKIVIEDDNFVVFDGTAVYITFLMKAKTGTNQSGVTVNIIDKGSTKTACNETTAVLSSVDTNDADEDELNGFVRVNIFVTNFLGDKFERKFAVEIYFGTTEKIVQDANKLTKGYALFTGIESAIVSEEKYNAATSSGTYSGTCSLGAELINVSVDDENSDEYNISYASSGASKIRSDVVTSITDYTGALGGSIAVGGEKDNGSDENVIAGVINNKYADNYAALADVKDDLKALVPDEGNDNVQALVIYNKEKASYGFIAGSRSLSAGSSVLVEVKLRVYGAAKAYVYLTSTEPFDDFNVLAVEGKKVNRDGKKPVYSTSKEDAEVYEELFLTATESDCDGSWLTLSFFITAGENELPYRVEIFNGSRDGAEDGLSKGLVVIDSVNYSSEKTAEEYKNEIEATYGTSDKDVIKTYAGAVKTVTYTDNDGFNNIKYVSDPSAKEVYAYYDNAKAIIASYENIDVQLESDESTPVTEPENTKEKDEEKEENYNLPLQITSIVISVVLIIVLLLLVFRSLIKKTKKPAAAENYYNRNSREKTQDIINRNKAKREAAAKKKAEEGVATPEAESAEDGETDETSGSDEDNTEITEEPAEETPYDYDNPDNNVPKDE